MESRGDLPGSVPSSWLGQALPNARQCGACFYGEVPGSAIAFGFGPELRPTSGRGLERLLDQEWLRLPTACLLRSAGFPDEQLRPPLQLQALRRYSARSVPERPRSWALVSRGQRNRPRRCHAWSGGGGRVSRRGVGRGGSRTAPTVHRRWYPTPDQRSHRRAADCISTTKLNPQHDKKPRVPRFSVPRKARVRPGWDAVSTKSARSRGRRSPLPTAGAGPRRS